MEEDCAVIKNEVLESSDLCYAENIEGKFFTSPKQMVENHYDGYPIKYTKDLDFYVSGETEGLTQDMERTLPKIEHFMAGTEHSESDNIYKFSDINNINGTTSFFSTDEDVASSSSRRKKEKALKKGLRPFACNICEKKFNAKHHLTCHMMIHTGLRPFTCDICEMKFTFKHNLKNHVITHTGVRPFACDICGKNFYFNSELTKHKKYHSGVRPYSCDICGKSFYRNPDLTKHKKIHTGLRPFTCDICGKSFTKKDHLTGHMNVHAGLRPFTCDICGKSYTQQSNLTQHMNAHAGSFACDICEKNFTTKQSLTIHKNIHIALRPFTCNICDKRYTQQSNLTRHMNTHAALRPFTCDICGKSFAQQGHLTKHMDVHADFKEYFCCECDKSFIGKFRLKLHLTADHFPDCTNRTYIQKGHQKSDNKEAENIHTKLEANLPENLTVKEELYFSELADNSIMEDQHLSIKNEVIETPDLCSLEDIQKKFVSSPKQMVENHDDNIRKYIKLLEGYMSGETQGSTQEIETALQEIDNFIEIVESSKSEIKNEPSI